MIIFNKYSVFFYPPVVKMSLVSTPSSQKRALINTPINQVYHLNTSEYLASWLACPPLMRQVKGSRPGRVILIASLLDMHVLG